MSSKEARGVHCAICKMALIVRYSAIAYLCNECYDLGPTWDTLKSLIPPGMYETGYATTIKGHFGDIHRQDLL